MDEAWKETEKMNCKYSDTSNDKNIALIQELQGQLLVAIDTQVISGMMLVNTKDIYDTWKKKEIEKILIKNKWTKKSDNIFKKKVNGII